jgi:hypothetical protein
MTRAVRSGRVCDGRSWCRRSTAFGRDHLGGNLSTDLGVEAVSGEQGVCSGAALAGIGDARERSSTALEEPARRLEIRFGNLAFRPRSPFLEQLVDDGSVDALLMELLAEDSLPPRTRPITRRDPCLGEGPVVEHPELEQALDGAIDEGRPVPRARQPAAHLHDGPWARLEKPGCGSKDGIRIVDGPSTLASFGKRLAPACRLHQNGLPTINPKTTNAPPNSNT